MDRAPRRANPLKDLVLDRLFHGCGKLVPDTVRRHAAAVDLEIKLEHPSSCRVLPSGLHLGVEHHRCEVGLEELLPILHGKPLQAVEAPIGSSRAWATRCIAVEPSWPTVHAPRSELAQSARSLLSPNRTDPGLLLVVPFVF